MCLSRGSKPDRSCLSCDSVIVAPACRGLLSTFHTPKDAHSQLRSSPIHHIILHSPDAACCLSLLKSLLANLLFLFTQHFNHNFLHKSEFPAIKKARRVLILVRQLSISSRSQKWQSQSKMLQPLHLQSVHVSKGMTKQ